MKICQGTFNYVFSKNSLGLLEKLGLPAEQKKEASGCIVQNFWIKTSSKDLNFCIQFREIINEDELLTSRQAPALQNIAPGFLEKAEAHPPAVSLDFQILGILVQDLPLTQQYLKKWKFDFEIVLSSSDPNDPFHKLSYKKLFPFWAILLSCPSLAGIPAIEEIESTEIKWKNQKALWFHLETTSWDFIIVEKAPG